MKMIALLLSLLVVTIARADEIKVLEVSDYVAGAKVEFNVNRDFGRAWVEVSTFTSHDPDSELGNSFYRVNVPGLSYDAATRAVVFEKDGALVECGKLRKAGIIGNNFRIKKTGNCVFNTKSSKVLVDNGFEMTYVRMFQVFMNVQ